MLGCLPPDVEPRATGHVPEMIVLMRRLIDAGHAYAAGGDVYFDVSSYAGLRRLSGQRLEHMRPAGDTEGADAKRDPRDFALWKGAQAGRAVLGDPVGPGPPGLAPGVLGDGHQVPGRRRSTSTAAAWTWSSRTTRTSAPSPARPATASPGTGCTTAWVGHRRREDEQVAGQLAARGRDGRPRSGPSSCATTWARRTTGPASSTRAEALAEAAAAYRRIEGFVIRAAEQAAGPAASGAATDPAAIPAPFAAALDDDLGVPQALAVVHEAVHAGNAALAAGDSAARPSTSSRSGPCSASSASTRCAEPWSAGGGSKACARSSTRWSTVALDQRQAARARKDYAAADAIRDGLIDAGIVVEDTPRGPRWELGR